MELLIAINDKAMRNPCIVAAWQRYMAAGLNDPVAGLAARIIPDPDYAGFTPQLVDEPN